MMQRKIQLKTREETLQNIILDLSCFHYFSLNRYIILFHPLCRIQINFRDRETMKNRTTRRGRSEARPPRN